MNERIRELAKQAGFSSWVLNPSVETQSDTPELLNRFAELIVQECYEICKGNLIEKRFGTSTEHDLSYNDGVMDCAIMLKQHFGVK